MVYIIIYNVFSSGIDNSAAQVRNVNSRSSITRGSNHIILLHNKFL